MTKRKITSAMMALSVLSVCPAQAISTQNNLALQKIASQVMQSFSCKSTDLEAQVWDGLKGYLMDQKVAPSLADMQSALQVQLQDLIQKNPALTSQDLARISQVWNPLLQTLFVEAPQAEKASTTAKLLMLWSSLDVGDQSSTQREVLHNKIQQEFSQIKLTMNQYNLSCSQIAKPQAMAETTTADDADYNALKQEAINAGVPLSSFGDRWVFATTYQSCQSEQLPTMTAQTPDTEGIKIVGTFPDGIGKRRVISSVSELQKTDYYIKDMNRVNSGCFDVTQKPLIYNYGGKPSTTTAANSTLDLFTPGGNGQPGVLGIDCSGYVFSSMAAAGLRLKEGRALKASDVLAWGSSSYLNPQKNGLTCLDKISVTPTDSLHAGDIVAVNGHVLLIDKAGADPFGIQKIPNQSECAKITSDNFDFVIAQSSTSKGGIGINYFEARDFLPTDSAMQTGLQKYAYYACVAHFQKKSSTPNVSTLAVVRHKGTAECLAPRVKLEHESCIQSCSSLLR